MKGGQLGRPARRRGVAGPLLALLLGAAAAVGLAELGLRAMAGDGSSAGRVRHVRLREHPPGVSYLVEPSAAYRNAVDGEFRPGLHRLRVDARGFIEPSRVHERADLDVVFLGGSTTECLYVEELERFPYRVGRLLERRGRRVNAWNGGVAGNSTIDSLNRLVNVALPLEPGVVVVMHNVNDLAVLLHAGSYWNDLPTRGPLVREDLRWSVAATARELKNRFFPNLWSRAHELGQRVVRAAGRGPADEFAGVRGAAGPPDADRLAGEFAAGLRAIVGVCRAHGALPVLMTMPGRLAADPGPEVRGGMGNLPLGPGADYDTVRALFERFNETVREVGRAEGVTVVDLADEVPPDPLYFYDVVHLTDEGSRLVAGIVAPAIDRALRGEAP